MDLFNSQAQEPKNLLPADGIVYYYGQVLQAEEAGKYLRALLGNIAWKNDEAVIFGKRLVTKRAVAWYGAPGLEYTYSGITRKALPWTEELLALKALAEEKTGETYNSCLLNLYHSGEEGMGWHSDAEKALKKDGAIASLSFGAERKFAFRHKKSRETVSLILEHGSLLVMKGPVQTHWLHRLPPMLKVKAPRVNLTFRTIVL